MNTATTIVSVILTVVFAIAGITKLAGVKPIINQFKVFDLDETWVFVIGFLEVAGAIGVQLEAFDALAAIGLAILMLSAFFFHVVKEGFAQGIPALILCALSIFYAVVAWPPSLFA